jgi:hypothetical protein
MREKLKAHFLRFGPRRFVAFTVLSLLVTDLLNSYYLKLYWASKDLSNAMVYLSIKRSSLSVSEFAPETLTEMKGFVDNAFSFFLLVILANNLFFYFFYLRKKLWAQGFVLFYALTATFFSMTFIFDGAALGVGWLAYNMLTIPFYLYVYTGVKLLKAETTLEPGKKGR